MYRLIAEEKANKACIFLGNRLYFWNKAIWKQINEAKMKTKI